MSPPHPHTVTIVAEDDDDNDICPVCDGQCTCSNNTPSSYYHQPSPSSTTTSPARDPPRPVLKIKLPPNILKRKLPQPSSSTSGPSSYSIPSSSIPSTSARPLHLIPKRRGRPPKNPALRAAYGLAPIPSTSAYQRPKPKSAATQKKTSKSSTAVRDGGIRKKTIKKRKRVDFTDDSSSELTDIDHLYPSNNSYHTSNTVDADDDDARSVQFPTFVSAPSSNSSSSSSDSDSLSGFETDSSIEAEEENFILAEERARVRRELLHGGEESLQKRRDNNWVIRPRERSVGPPDDVDMDGDSDGTEDANGDDDEQQDEDEDEDEADEEDTEDTDIRRHGFSGLVTAWSDDEESSFDADLFFANLSDKDSDSGSATQSDDGEQGDFSDFDIEMSQTAASLIPHLRQGVGIGIPNLAFEVTEGWDGQVVFTNGLVESSSQGGLHRLVQSAFLPPGPETSPSPGPDGDVDMLSTDVDGEPDEEGYEQDVGQDTAEAEGEGDTTDEELVGEDDLPNERAMSLFNTPFSFNNVSFVNPLSTLSPHSLVKRQRPLFGAETPRPSDILGQPMQWEPTEPHDDSEDGTPEEEEESVSVREQKAKEKAARGGLPRAGVFEIPDKTRQIVIDGENKDIPSSYPKFIRRRTKGVKSLSLSVSEDTRVGGFDSLLRNSLSTPLRPSSLPPPSTRHNFLLTAAVIPLIPSGEVPEETNLESSANITSPSASLLNEPVTAQPTPIELDDVLDASFLAGAVSTNASQNEEPESPTSNTDAGSSLHRYSRSFNRWDMVSVGALRKPGALTDSAAGWGSDSGPDYAAYSNVMKSSPLSTMLWHHRNGVPKQQRSLGYAMSPELGPIKDGDRTPTNGSRKQNNSPPFNSPSRKALRKERKLKRKSYGPVNNHQKQHRLHHTHSHHPNSKFRSNSSSQRANFSSTMPPLSI